eukprot:RCo043850
MWSKLMGSIVPRGSSFTFDVSGENIATQKSLQRTLESSSTATTGTSTAPALAGTPAPADPSASSEPKAATAGPTSAELLATLAQSMTITNASMNRDPTMPYVLPPKKLSDSRKYTVVLDLDETLVYGREGPLFTRPGLDELLAFLGENCETVVWTAGEREYAKRIIRSIDPTGVIEHCIYRHPKWFTAASHFKDLSLCNRDIEYTILIDNTPDCIRGQAPRSVLVPDYWGVSEETGDNTLPCVAKLLHDLVKSGLGVREFLQKCPLVTCRFVTSRNGNEMYLYCLDLDKAALALAEDPPPVMTESFAKAHGCNFIPATS